MPEVKTEFTDKQLNEFTELMLKHIRENPEVFSRVLARNEKARKAIYQAATEFLDEEDDFRKINHP